MSDVKTTVIERREVILSPTEVGAIALAKRAHVNWDTFPDAIKESYRDMSRVVLEATSNPT